MLIMLIINLLGLMVKLNIIKATQVAIPIVEMIEVIAIATALAIQIQDKFIQILINLEVISNSSSRMEYQINHLHTITQSVRSITVVEVSTINQIIIKQLAYALQLIQETTCRTRETATKNLKVAKDLAQIFHRMKLQVALTATQQNRKLAVIRKSTQQVNTLNSINYPRHK